MEHFKETQYLHDEQMHRVIQSEEFLIRHLSKPLRFNKTDLFSHIEPTKFYPTRLGMYKIWWARYG